MELNVAMVVSSVDMNGDEGKLEVSVDLESVAEDVSTCEVVSSIIFVERVEEAEMNVDIEDEMVFVSVSIALLLDCCSYELEVNISPLEVRRISDEVISVRVDNVVGSSVACSDADV